MEFLRSISNITSSFNSASTSTSTTTDVPSLALAPEALRPRNELRLLTWNVWFDSYEFDRRSLHILNFIVEEDVDVVCLQEVTPRFLSLVRSVGDGVLLQRYDISDGQDLTGATIGSYGVLMMCKKEFQPRYEFVPFPSRMGRQLLFAVLSIPTADASPSQWCVGTVHLESLSNASRRQQQLEICQKTLATFSHAGMPVVLCGDFNFCSYRNYDQSEGSGVPLENDFMVRILDGYVDLWSHLIPFPQALLPPVLPGQTPPTKTAIRQAYDRCSPEVAAELGLTFDSCRNDMIHQFERMRYDRVMFLPPRLHGMPGWTPLSIEMTGTDAIYQTSEGKNVLPSDHFGLLVRFYNGSK